MHGLISKRSAELDGVTVTRVTFSPGARWSNDLKEYAGTCTFVEFSRGKRLLPVTAPGHGGHPPAVDKQQAGDIVARARVRAGLSWAELAGAIGKPPVKTVAALLGQHPVPPADARKIGELLGPDDAVVEALCLQPYRGETDHFSDPTIYRFHEALSMSEVICTDV